jgi:hypothetical protein
MLVQALSSTSLQQRLMVEASARMLSTVDQTLGTLVDVKA